MVVTFLALLSQLSSGLVAASSACVPNTHFLLNGKICRCNNLGWWVESDCRSIARRGGCLPGQVTWQGCSQCICQENGQLRCSDTTCYEDVTNRGDVVPTPSPFLRDNAKTWCTPFKSYYINCSICVCPASGKTAEAHCAKDSSCQQLQPSSAEFLLSVNKNICIPKVMYLFPCLHCLCSDGGYFALDKCVETCQRQIQTESTRRCISRTFYRKNCNVCWCPDDNIPNDKLCTQTPCNKDSKFKSIESFRSVRTKCRPHSFVKPKCIYCGCNTNGNVNENACLQLDCLKANDLKYDVAKTTCSPGEMVPTCVECFCLRVGITNDTYCSNVCSYQSKLRILEKVLKDSSSNHLLIERNDIKMSSDGEMCEPNTMYIDQGRYCLCPENGSTNFKLCTSVTVEVKTIRPSKNIISHDVKENLNANCTPNTLVKIDCNTCYCGKNGRIDPKWCTYDDCYEKRIIQDAFKASRVSLSSVPEKTTCVPGSMSKVDCNYCICPESGKLAERACTKNICSEDQQEVEEDQFSCEPLAYYLVDCNVCLCPQDGVKNVEKCTKKICEKTFLRSDSCVPGEFFSSGCNVCVCPPDGNKIDKVCTNHRCSDFDTPWKKIFRLSKSLLVNQVSQNDNKRQLDVCFSGEEFEIDCKICVCTDVGLRSHSTCTESLCKEDNNGYNVSKNTDDTFDENVGGEIFHTRYRRDQPCTTFNVSHSSERKDCTPGSMYIIRCRQCICPYMGNINSFCRPLPAGTFCEQAFPNYNYIPMGRRNDEVNSTSLNVTTPPFMPMNHDHTKYACSTPGKVLDECFVCECQDNLELIEEHCFKSTGEKCKDAVPTFLDTENKVVVM
ncbi:hypothetical protein ABMA27_008855 [Loxostege sticticalis]|uniref:Pacifastin domain-containing protein n=1 Tax=Loxostege sticticalis TaxID=481309 RepID=A0ABR3H933_LOXSC